MTTHDEQTATTPTPPSRPESSSAGTELPTARTVPSASSDNPSSATMGTDSPPRQDGPPIVDEESSMARAEQSQTGNAPPTAGSNRRPTNHSSPPTIFQGCARAGTMSRRLSSTTPPSVSRRPTLSSRRSSNSSPQVSRARSRLEAQWARGQDASTEELRLALRRYREFFQRLLAV